MLQRAKWLQRFPSAELPTDFATVCQLLHRRPLSGNAPKLLVRAAGLLQPIAFDLLCKTAGTLSLCAGTLQERPSTLRTRAVSLLPYTGDMHVKPLHKPLRSGLCTLQMPLRPEVPRLPGLRRLRAVYIIRRLFTVHGLHPLRGLRRCPIPPGALRHP